MNNTFINKVQAERRVLLSVNKYTTGVGQLTGLSSSAIEDWVGRHALVVAHSEVAIQLKGLAAVCQTLSDRSHETFSLVANDSFTSFEAKLLSLQEGLNDAFARR